MRLGLENFFLEAFTGIDFERILVSLHGNSPKSTLGLLVCKWIIVSLIGFRLDLEAVPKSITMTHENRLMD